MRPAPGKLLAVAAVAVVALAVVAGALSVADPFTQRRIRFDERRVSDLAELSDLVGCYWRDRGRLPSDSDQFAAWVAERPSRAVGNANARCWWRDTVDPATNSPYDYRLLSDTSFELCGTFSEDSRHGPPLIFTTRGWETDHWKHPAGEHCFRFEVRPPSEPAGDAVIVPLRES